MVESDRCDPARPLRRDAEQNRQRILRAAAEVFTARGLQATLDDVARHAGASSAVSLMPTCILLPCIAVPPLPSSPSRLTGPASLTP